MKYNAELKAKIVEALQGCLTSVPFLKAVKLEKKARDWKGIRTDLLVEIRLRDGEKKWLALRYP